MYAPKEQVKLLVKKLTKVKGDVDKSYDLAPVSMIDKTSQQ